MKRIHMILLTILITAAALLSLPMTAYADMGPKPSVELHIKNPPEGLYYVDLLVDCNNGDAPQSGDYNMEMVEVLKNINIDGLKARFGLFMGMDNTINKPNEAHTYYFTYYISKPFRVVIVTEDLRTIISPEIDPYGYNSEITFDAAANELSENGIAAVINNLIAFFITCTLTLIIERIVFLIGKMHIHRNKHVDVFILANIATQILLYGLILTMSRFDLEPGDLPLGRFTMVLAEVIIAAVECVIYVLTMKETERGRIVKCTIWANVISALMSIPVFLILAFIKLIY